MLNLKKLGFVTAGALMLFAVGATMTACNKSVGKVDAKTITYDGTKITWEEAKNADAYLVKVNDGSERRVTSTHFNYTAKASEEEVVVSICALQERKNGEDKESKASSRTFTRLETISESTITFDEVGVMSWGEISGADSYLLSLNGEVISVDGTTYGDDATREFPKGKQLKIKVRPQTADGSTFSSWSTEYTKIYIADVTSIKYDGDTLQWTPVQYADKYEVTIAGEAEPFVVNQSKLTYPGKADDVIVSIKALSDSANIFSSEMDESKTFVYLAKPTGLDVQEGRLVWNPNEKADEYEIKINGISRGTTEEAFYQLPTNQTLELAVKPLIKSDSAEAYFSIWSDTLQAFVLNAPTLTWNQAAIAETGEEGRPIGWSIVTGSVGGYKVKIIKPNGEEQLIDNLNTSAMDFPYAFNESGGEYTVSVAAKTGGVNVYDSPWSQPIVVERLAAPTNPQVTSDPSDNSWFEVTWAPVTGTSSYNIIRDNQKTVVTGTSKRFTDIIPDNDTLGVQQNYLIQSRGTDFEPVMGGGGKVRLASIIPNAESGLTVDVCKFEITSRATPTGIQCTEGSWDMTWNSVTAPNGYYVYDGDSKFAPTTTASLDLKTLSNGMDYTFSVAAAGDGKNVLASNRNGGWKNVRRLAVPYNLRINESSTFNPMLEWETVDSANSFSLIVNGETVDLNVTIGTNIASQYITTQGTRFAVSANGLYDDGQKFYVSSDPCDARTFGRLERPTFSNTLVNKDRELQWTAPGNFASIGDPFTYTIYNMSKDVLVSGIPNTKISIEELSSNPNATTLEAGEHSFYIRAIGSGGSINSEFSDVVKFTVLETPTITITDNAYTWAGVPGATDYTLQIGNLSTTDIPYSEENKRYEYTPTKEITEYKENGYDVSVVAIGDNGQTRVDSQPFSMKQYVARVGTPSFSFVYKDVEGNETDMFSPDGKLEVTVNPVANANGYVFTVGKVENVFEKEDGLTYTKTFDSPGAFEVKVSARGGCFDENGIFYLDTAQGYVEGAKKSIWLHSPVTNLVSDNNFYSFGWDYVAPAGYVKPSNGFKVVIYYKDGTGKETKTIEKVTGYSYRMESWEDFNDVKKVEVYVNACTDGEIYEIGSQVASITRG